MILLLLLFQIALPTNDAFDLGFSNVIPASENYCSSNSCIYTSFSEVSLTLTEPRNISFSYISQKQFKFIDLFFDSGSQLDQIGNRTIVPVNRYDENFTVQLNPVMLGHTVLHIYATPIQNFSRVTQAFVFINVRKSPTLSYVCSIIGWIYFIAWSISFYPQIVLNFQRKSVVGLHFDFLSLNVIGFLFYTIFNIGLYWIPAIQNEYFYRHPFGVDPVQLNDVIFSIHAVLACLLLVFQCLIYDRGDQVISKTAQTIIGAISTFSIVFLVVACVSSMSWLDYMYCLSYVRLFITLIKYIPQAYYNHVRRSTAGWSIGNILLDFTGGFLSIVQMFILSYNYNDYESIFGDPTKFGLGLFSMSFDIFFIVQHYCLYKNYDGYEEISQVYTEDSHAQSIRSEVTYGSVEVEAR